MADPFAIAADLIDPPPPPDYVTSPLAFGVRTGRGRYKRARHLEVMERECLRTIDEAGRLLLEVSIRHGKTQILERLVAVFIGTNPDKRVIWGAHSADFAARRGRRIRDLLQEYGEELFGIRVSRKSEAAHRWDIEGHEGGMITVGVGGSPIGEGADLMVIDDPIKSFEAAMSPVQRGNVNEWIAGTMLSRLEPGAAVIMALARWHEDDPGGFLLREDPDNWRSLRMPGLCDDPDNDPLDRELGEPLWPDRYSLAEHERRRNEMTAALGEVVWLAQVQQRPTTPKGGKFPEDKWRFMTPEQLVHVADGAQWVRAWDLAATADGGDWTVGVLMTRLPDGRTVIADVRRGRWESFEVNTEIETAAATDPWGTHVQLPQDPGQAGKAQGQQLVAMLAGHIAEAEIQSGSKEVRAAFYAAQQQAGNVYLVEGDWNGKFIGEHSLFPRGSNDDQVDAAATGFNHLAGHPLAPAKGKSAARERLPAGAALARRSGRRITS